MIALAAEETAGWTTASTLALIGVAVTLFVGLLTLAINGIRAERARRRGIYAVALGATFDYREFAYVVRRRQAAMPADERVRISDALRVVQRDLDHHLALLQIERSRQVEARYGELVAETRRIAGRYMHDSWKQGHGIEADAEMNMSGIDFSALDTFVDAYLEAVRKDLEWWRP